MVLSFSLTLRGVAYGSIGDRIQFSAILLAQSATKGAQDAMSDEGFRLDDLYQLLNLIAYLSVGVGLWLLVRSWRGIRALERHLPPSRPPGYFVHVGKDAEWQIGMAEHLWQKADERYLLQGICGVLLILVGIGWLLFRHFAFG